MKDKIRVLIHLQDCDNRIKKIIDRKNEGPLRIQRLEAELKAYELNFQEEYTRLESLKKDRREIELNIQDLEDSIVKSNIKLSNIKSNKEYRAALKEIEDFKKGQSQIEDKAIQLMEEIEVLEKKRLENKDKQKELQIKFEKDKEKIMTELNGLDKKLEGLERERIKLCQTTDQELLDRYLFLKDRKEGLAISSVVSAVCQTCHMGIPPQKFNELIKGNSLLTCPNCYRIIYWGEDEKFQ